MTNVLRDAAETLKKGWCRDTYRDEMRDGETFCSMGALITAKYGLTEKDWLDDTQKMNDAVDDCVNAPETKLLRDVVLENYPEAREYATTPAGRLIVWWNDNIIEHGEEAVAMFEKAAVRWDETP